MAKASPAQAQSPVVATATIEGASAGLPAMSSRKKSPSPATGIAANATVKPIPGNTGSRAGSITRRYTGVSAVCASLKERDRSAIPRKSDANNTARGISVAKMISTECQGSANSMSRLPPSWKRPV